MSITGMFNYLRFLGLPVVIVVGIELLLIAGYYTFYYRKRRREEEHWLPMSKLILGALFIGYIVFVLQLTVIGRGTSHFLEMNLYPFGGYIEAWQKYSLREFQNGIFNILMFVPLGILLPCLSYKFRAFKRLLLVVVCATLAIETYQTLTGAGLFEVDDLINNTLGGIMGYQLYRLAASIIKHKKVKIKSLLGNLSIPIAIGLMFCAMSIVYNQQEFGQLAINSYHKWNMKGVELSTSLTFSPKPNIAAVYKRVVTNDVIAALLRQKLALTELSVKKWGSDRESVLTSNSGTHFTLFQSEEGNWSLTENDYVPGQASLTDSESMLEKAKTIAHDLSLPTEKAELRGVDDGEYAWSLSQIPGMSEDYWSGDFSIGLKEDGSIYAINSGINHNQFVRTMDLLSPAEVYKRIEDGEFQRLKRNALLTKDELEIKKGDHLEIKGIELTYMYDSKDFYRPVYQVNGTYNGDPNWFTLIDAKN
ncbi:VanZ family protein [Paenibacillus sp. TAF43_2]|uniref:VanZ family protein n=1 Tax=Paenibacillus sp. TAF43_2 TaxID=3233069 RepID=UPI003F9875A1